MNLNKTADKIMETDVLVVGGGMAGCPAAVKARENGLKVILVEKANTARSGSAGVGMDHYPVGIRDHMSPREFLSNWDKIKRETDLVTDWADPTRSYRLYAHQLWSINELEKIGIPMRWDDGELRPTPGHATPQLRVHWLNVKPALATAMRNREVEVLERTMVVDLLTKNGDVVGATAINTRTGEFIVIKAKAVIIATGSFGRCYSPSTPTPWKYKFLYHYCPSSMSGDGWATAFRAGVELVNMDYTDIGILISDELSISFGNIGQNEGILPKIFSWDGQELPIRGMPRPLEYAELEKAARDPIYYSIEHLPDDFQKRVEAATADERPVSFKLAQDRGFNPRSHRYVNMTNRPFLFRTPAGINTDGYFKSTVTGLYAVGDATNGGHSCVNAACGGLLAGNDIVDFVKNAVAPEIDVAQVEAQKEIAMAPLYVKDGTEPMELECAIRYICDRYVGLFRSEGKLREGMRRLGTLKRVFIPRLMAKNPHYLMRCLEVRNILDLAKVHIQACMERKETRGDCLRLDYPERAPSLDGKLQFQKLENGKLVSSMRKLTPLNMEVEGEQYACKD
jgi:succinate dehydrogenase/fumarate reductase flavoprotein subunit